MEIIAIEIRLDDCITVTYRQPYHWKVTTAVRWADAGFVFLLKSLACWHQPLIISGYDCQKKQGFRGKGFLETVCTRTIDYELGFVGTEPLTYFEKPTSPPPPPPPPDNEFLKEGESERTTVKNGRILILRMTPK